VNCNNAQVFEERLIYKTAIVDGRIINHHEAEKLGFTYYGVGFGKISIKQSHKKT